MKDFRSLQVWQRGHELALAVYDATRQFPRSELYGLTSQARRASVAIPANIAEGCGRHRETSKEMARFFQMAFASACELESHLIFMKDSRLFAERSYAPLRSLLIEIKKMLSSYLRRLRFTPGRLPSDV